jgi:L-ascorbate metabolism protein UlaG (beta-lactamase superfamily)
MTPGHGRLVWIGHATVVLELGGSRLITDPVLTGRIVYLRRHGAAPDPAVLERLDGVLLSHLHFDHLHLPSLRRLGRHVPVLAPRGAGRLLSRSGFAEVAEIAAGESTTFCGVPVTAVPADHDPRRHPRGPAAPPLGFLAGAGPRVYFAGDTALFAGMAELAGRVDVALLPVWGWGPTLGEGHMGPREAAEALVLIRPRAAVPIHWGTLFPIGLARDRGAALVAPPRAFARLAAGLAPEVRVEILEPGGDLTLD